MKLWRYIQGDRKGKEAHRIEKKAMSDPFLADALEGYEKIQGSHQREAAKLQKEIKRRQKSIANKSLGKKNNHLKAWSIAASILVAAGIGTWFLLDGPVMQKDRYMVETNAEEEPKSATPPPSADHAPDSAETTPGNSVMAQAKTTTADKKKIQIVEPITIAEDESANSKPRPAVGMEAYMGYIQRNLKRPTDDECRNAEGSVVVVFKIGQSGRPYNIKVTQGLCSSTNKEAIRLIINGPNWKKGSDSDEATITINF